MLLSKYFLEKEDKQSLYIEDKGVIVYRIDERKGCHIDIIYVDPNHRREGIGTKLADELLKKHPEIKYMTAAVYTEHKNPTSSLQAILTYGFEIVGSNHEQILLYKEIK